MRDTRSRLAVIVGSNRRGRFAPTVARWLECQLRQRDNLDVDIIDLAEERLPDVLADFGEEPPAEVAALSPRLAGADAFIVVTPEYNHGVPGVLKTAIDWYRDEWKAKPVAFVSYGSIAGGLRAVEHLRQVFAELHATTVRDTVSFHGAWEQFDARGEPVDPDGVNGALKVMLDQLDWWAQALAEARDKRPYMS